MPSTTYISPLSLHDALPILSYLNNLSNDKHPSMEEIMHNNYTFNLTLAEYAKLACKSIPTFKRDFKKVFKDTPAKWVVKKRLNRSEEHTSELQSPYDLVCRLPPTSPLFPYTTLFRSYRTSITCPMISIHQWKR